MHGDMTLLYVLLFLVQPLVGIFAALTAADIVQTYFFPRFGLKEGNRWIAKLMSQYGFDEVFLVKYVIFFGFFVAAGQGWIPPQGMWLAIGLQAAVLVWNAVKMIQGYRERRA
jgi:membrane-bound metal-dependent hydrolase YbcI (DUF457 family)